ncbi:DUF1028 domain-containing protein [Thermoleophilia bacterium SCSIO 60948]|nr:DUF1028 domain-containing protein [Thermoleophilia bacterium SCSIO 60948]
MTFSILGRCEQTGRLGMAVTSSSLAVASRCAFVRAGVGVATSQNVTDPRLGPKLLDALAAGASAQRALDTVAAAAPYAEYRQLGVVDAAGSSAAWNGEHALGVHGSRTGEGWVAAGNLLAAEEVLDAIGPAFAECEDSELEVRLIAGLAAGLRAGGEAGPVTSAGLLVAGEVEWPVTNLRIDWAPEDGPGPIAELAQLWERWAPERDDYVTRALDPSAAPSYGVPGDPGE